MSADLLEQITQRRWYGSKSRTATHAEVLDTIAVREELTIALVELRYDTGAHDVYQVLLTGDEIELGRELVGAMRTRATLRGSDGAVDFHPADGFTALDRELRVGRLIESEQSNSSVVFDDALILKVFRRLEPGINPEVELLRFLAERGFPNVPAFGGAYEYAGGPLSATLGFVQEFVAGGVDGWQLALDGFLRPGAVPRPRLPARRGHCRASQRACLRPERPGVLPEDPSAESLALFAAAVDEEVGHVFFLPEDDESFAPIAGHEESAPTAAHPQPRRLRGTTHSHPR